MKKLLLLASALCALLVAAFAVAAPKRILYFTEGVKTTTGEASEIAKLRAITPSAFEVRIINGKMTSSRKRVAADYMAGAIPATYRDGGIDSGTVIYPVMDPNTPPRPNILPSNEAMLYSGQAVPIAGGGSLTVTIAGGVITATVLVKPDAGS